MPEFVITLRLETDELDLAAMKELAYKAEEQLSDRLDENGIDYKMTGTPSVTDLDNRKTTVDEDPKENRLGKFRAGQSDTARKAAIQNYPRSGTQRHMVLMAIVLAGEEGRTSDEISRDYEIRLYTVKPRIVELREGGWIEMNGKMRPSETGAGVDVHVATEKGREYAREREDYEIP